MKSYVTPSSMSCEHPWVSVHKDIPAIMCRAFRPELTSSAEDLGWDNGGSQECRASYPLLGEQAQGIVWGRINYSGGCSPVFWLQLQGEEEALHIGWYGLH